MEDTIQKFKKEKKDKGDNRPVKDCLHKDYLGYEDLIIKHFCKEVTVNPNSKTYKVNLLKSLGIDTSKICEAN